MTRSFENTLLFETALDSIPSSNIILTSVSDRVFSPVLNIVEEECSTELGTDTPISFRAEGLIELETGLPLTDARLTTIILSNKITVATRHTSSCVSVGGVCRECFMSTYPSVVIPVTDRVKVVPEVLLDAGKYYVLVGQTIVPLKHSEEIFDRLDVFLNGVLISASSYTISGSTLTFGVPSASNIIIVVKYIVRSNSVYYHWLSRTYAASLLGIKPLLTPMLPIRKSLFKDQIPEEDLEDLIRSLKTSEIKEEDSVVYIDSIEDKVEKAIYVILLSSIFLST